MQGDAKKIEAVVVIAVIAAVYFLCGIPDFMTEKCWKTALLHHFFHVNILHLVINSYAVWMLFAVRGVKPLQFATGYVIGTLAYFAASVPAIGFSNILYALIGLGTPSLKSRWWRSPNTIIFLSVMAGYLFVPKVSALTHIVSFVGAVAVCGILRLFNSIIIDYDRAKGQG